MSGYAQGTQETHVVGTSETVWEPAHIFAEHDAEETLHKDFAIVILNQDMALHSLSYRRLWDNSIFEIAADGGANRVFQQNFNAPYVTKGPFLDIDVIIGDLDSLLPQVKEYWKSKHTEVIQDPDQDSTDFTKAVKYIKSWTPETSQSYIARRAAKGRPPPPNEEILPPKDIVCIGGIGGRIDQSISQLHHLYMFQDDPKYTTGRMFLLSDEGLTFVLKTGTHKIHVRDPWLGKHIGILPLKEPSTITTTGLEWDVTDWVTSFGGQMSTSNHVKEDWITITTTRDVLFTIDLAVPSPVSRFKARISPF